MLAEPTGYGCEKVVPRKGLEPPLSYREADFKLTAVGSQGFVTVLMRTGTWSQISLLRVFRVCANCPELTGTADIKDPQKDPQIFSA